MGTDEWEDLCRLEEGCEPRYPSEWTYSDFSLVNDALFTIMNQGCYDVVQHLELHIQQGKLALWDERVTRGGAALTGRWEWRELLPDFDHIYIWTGAGKVGGDNGDNVNLARTLAHEALHSMHRDDWEHDEIRALAEICGGGP